MTDRGGSDRGTGHRHELSLVEAADTLGVEPVVMLGLAAGGYVASTGADRSGDPVFLLSDVKAFQARNDANGSGFRPFDDPADILGMGEVDPQVLLEALDDEADDMAMRAFDLFAGIFPEARAWEMREQHRFIEQAKGRFEAILAVTGSGAEVDEALVGDLQDVGAEAAWSGSSLPQLLVILRISRDLVVQTAVELAESRGGHWGLALSLLLNRILPAIDRLTDALAQGYWAAIVGREEDARARYQHVVEASSDGIYEIDTDGVVSYANPAFEVMIGRPAVEMVGVHLLDVLAPLARDARVGELLHDTPTQVVVEHRRADGVRRVLDIRSQSRSSDGEIVGFQGVARDITAQTDLEADKNEFLSLVTYDLRQPLTSVLGMAATVESHAEELKPAQLARLGGQIRRQAERMARMADDLHDVSRLEAQTLILAPRPCSLLQAIEAGILAADPSAEVDIDIPPTLEVLADARRLEQVFANLIDNALEHGAPPIRVGVTVPRDPKEPVVVTITDRGLGVPEAVVPTLFSGLRTLGRPARDRSRGSGLGLALVRGLVEAMGGRAWYDTPGGVCTFHVALLPAPVRTR